MPTEIRIISVAEGSNYTASTRKFVFRFSTSGAGTNGTSLIVAYLKRARLAGASLVSGLSIYIGVTINNVPMECRTKILTRGEVAKKKPSIVREEPVSEYSTSVEAVQPRRTSTSVSELAYGCAKRPHVTNRPITPDNRLTNLYEYQGGQSWDDYFDVSNSRGYLKGIERRKDIGQEVRFEELCGLIKPVKHRVSRYEYQLAAMFTPPNIPFIRKRFADIGLVETEAECYGIETVSGHRIEGNIHKRSKTYEAQELVPTLTGR